MLESVKEFAVANAEWLAIALALVLLIAALWQRSVRFWLTDFWVNLPLIGVISRLCKDTTHGKDGWMRSEEKLCSKYKPFIILLSESRFNQRIEYMRKAGDLGRSPMPFWVLALLVILVIAEGLGFSYLIATWMARDGSPNTHMVFTFAIVLVICVIMVAVTHAAGQQYYRTSLLRACFKRYKDKDGQQYSSRPIALKDDQHSDDAEPDYIQCVNRVAKHSRDNGSYAAVGLALVAIAVIAVLSTFMRWQSLESELNRDSSLQSQSSAGNPFANGGLPLPEAVTSPQKEADDKARTDIRSSTEAEGLAAFLLLAFIFVITQIVSMGAGYKFGFAGKETLRKGEGAYKDTAGFPTYDAYWANTEPVIDLINSRVKDLQQRMEEYSHHKLKLTKTFEDYLRDSQKRSEGLRGNIDSESEATVHQSGQGVSIEDALNKIDALTEKDAKAEYFESLPADVQIRLTPILKKKKADAAKAARKANLEDLF
jgi:hypothetical protein